MNLDEINTLTKKYAPGCLLSTDGNGNVRIPLSDLSKIIEVINFTKEELLKDKIYKYSKEEVINLSLEKGSLVSVKEPRCNAVVSQVMPFGFGDDGAPVYQRFIHLECVDEEALPALRAEANKIINYK